MRFALTGGACAALQLLAVAALEAVSIRGLGANAIAFIIAAQVNFVLSDRFTWADRDAERPLWWRWRAFLVTIAGSGALNMAVFVIARTMVDDIPAAAMGIGVAASMNYLMGDRAIFAARPDRIADERSEIEPRQEVA